MPSTSTSCAVPRAEAPDLGERELLSPAQAGELASIFKLLANDSRLRMLHALQRSGELCVSELATEVGMTPQAVSNQLQRLVDRRVLAARRDGLNVHYRIVDPCLPALLDLAWCIVETTSPPARTEMFRDGAL